MALKDAEIEAIKAGIPARFQPPSEMGGTLSANFQSQGAMLAPYTLQGSANPFTDDRTRELAGLALADDSDATPSFMLTGAQLAMLAHGENSEQRKREKERLAYDQMQAALDRRLAELDAELAQIDERLDQIRQRKIEIGESMEAIDELEQLARTGKLDADNPTHAALLRRAGIDPSEARRRDMDDIIAQRRRDMSREDGALDTEWNDKMKRRGEVVRESEEVKAARAEIENADTPEAMEKAEHRARTVLGAQQLGEAAQQTNNQSAKIVAADAVGISATSEASNRLVATQTKEFFVQSDGEDWDNSPNEPVDSPTEGNTPETRPAAAPSIRPA